MEVLRADQRHHCPWQPLAMELLAALKELKPVTKERQQVPSLRVAEPILSSPFAWHAWPSFSSLRSLQSRYRHLNHHYRHRCLTLNHKSPLFWTSLISSWSCQVLNFCRLQHFSWCSGLGKFARMAHFDLWCMGRRGH